MDKQTVLTIMDAMAEKIEALTERVEAAEKKLAEQCSCRAWETRLRPDAGDVPQFEDGPFLTRAQTDWLVFGD